MNLGVCNRLTTSARNELEGLGVGGGGGLAACSGEVLHPLLESQAWILAHVCSSRRSKRGAMVFFR